METAAHATGMVRALPDWSAVPSDSEEDRLFFNGRLAYFGKVTFLMSAGFLGIGLVMTAILASPRTVLGRLTSTDDLGHIFAFSVSAVQWALCRSGRRSPRALNVIDAGGVVLAAIGYACMPLGEHVKNFAQIMVVVPATMITVVLRSIVLPGTQRRTFWISTAACLPMLAVAYYVARYHLNFPAALARAYTIQGSLWAVLIVAVSTLASRVIYGLQQRVRDAAEVGQYTLEEKIGEGGMGVVYRARHVLLRRSTAVKLLPPDRTGAQNLARFEREVQQTSRLTHPNTVAIYDYGHTADGIFYYAMEYLDGLTLEQLVQHDGPQPPARVAHLLRQACGALAEAHDAGLIHRDVKPANLMLCVRGGIADHLKVLDFGLVKELAKGNDAPELSTTGTFLGTPLYIAPEAITHPNQVDGRADLYALGAVGYFLLTGTPPFHGVTLIEICSKHLHAAPQPPSARSGQPVPPALDALILRCLAKRPEDRPASAAALAEALEAAPGVPAWTAAEARRWWQERGGPVTRAVAAARRDETATTPGQRTVAVDIGVRHQQAPPRPAAAIVPRADAGRPAGTG